MIFLYDEFKREFRSFPRDYTGFLSYELGYRFLGILPREKPGYAVPEVLFSAGDKIAFSNDILPGEDIISQHDFGKQSNFFKSYIRKIQKIKEKLKSGDTYQVNFAQRFAFAAPPSFSAYALFKELSAKNPSPHEFFYENDNFAVISNSPECLVRGFWEPARGESAKKKFIIETCPIKGTVPRGKTPEEDRRQIKKLLKSEKDEAELAMIVDLSRNDLGKICKPGTVQVKKHRAIQKLSHVIHTFSVVRGELREGLDAFDVLEAVFPGGSITGCPKKRTMEIIDELEDFQRGVYCGSAGYIKKDGSFEFNIMIRTAFLDKRTGILSFHAGGGIVIDSDPEKEYEETLHKTAAFLEVLDLAKNPRPNPARSKSNPIYILLPIFTVI